MIHRLLTSIRTPLGRKSLRWLLPLAVVPVLLAGIAQLIRDNDQKPAALASRAAIESKAFAAGVSARLAVAEAAAWTFTRSFSNNDRVSWRDQVAASDPFRRVAVTSGSKPDQETGSPTTVADWSPDHTSIALFGSGEQGMALYLVRRLQDSKPQWAYFELDPAWLWQDIQDANQRVAVLDGNGHWIYGGASLPENLQTVLATAVVSPDGKASVESSLLAWQSKGVEWRGAYYRIASNARIGGMGSWTVVVMLPSQYYWFSRIADYGGLGLILLAAVLAAVLLASVIAERYTLPLIELQSSILRIAKAEPINFERDLPEELQPLARDIALTGANVVDRTVFLQSLEEVDQLLLANGSLEPALEAILVRVLRVMRCHVAGLTLLDPDSPRFARVMLANSASTSPPVVRVTLDASVLDYLNTVESGITVTRCEEQRHSFLMPLQEQGGGYFWVWPVRADGRLAALMAVAYEEPPAPDPRYAEHGTEFAQRLSIALSNSARDESLYRQAYYDPLTGLPNRMLFNQRLDVELAAAKQQQHMGALLYVDLDHFKRINDTVGHAAGDQMLTIVAQRLRAAVKDGDLVARLAGDEFTIVLSKVDVPESAAMIAERVIESLQKPVNLSGRDHFVQASIGIALFPNDGANIEELLRNADGAMYRAKDMGRGRAVFFDRKLAISQLDPTNSGLFRALRRREFALFYQPQFDLANGALIGVEALLRWHTARDGTREPKEFVPAAESSGLIVDIGGWVLEAACAQFAAWRERGMEPPRVSINVSAQQLKYAEFPRTVRRVLEKFAMAPQQLELELTETVLADQTAGAALLQISALGVRIALDDFGTGYSSLNYLRQHPIQAVKIDRSFLEEVPSNAASATLAETIITMAHALGKEVVAEGVETEEQIQFLRDHNCDYAQGFYLARPMPADKFEELLRSRLPADDFQDREAG